MRKVFLTLALGVVCLTGSVTETAFAGPPPPPPPFPITTMVSAHAIMWHLSPCKYYRYFSSYADAMAFIAISVPSSYTYIGTRMVPSTYNLAYPGHPYSECISTAP